MMYGGFTYAGKHSFNDFGLVVKTVDRPLLAPQKTAQTEQARDGQGDYTAANVRGRALYDNKTLTVECKYAEVGDYRTLQARTARIAAWLSNLGGSYSPLVFDDMPLIVWSVKPANGIPIEFQWAAVGSFQITFDCEPFNRYTFDSSNIILDTEIPIDSRFQLGGAIELGETVTYFSTSAPTLPILRFKGAGDELNVVCGNNGVYYDKAWEGEFVLDCVTETAWLNGAQVETEGMLFEFLPGDNVLEITGGNVGGTIEAIYSFNVYYGEEE